MEKIESLIKDVVSQLQRRKETLALAESCTGGLVSTRFTDLAGVSSVYLGGVVSYANSAKEQLLSVPHALLEKHGAVSREVVKAMANGVRLRLSSSWSVAITGIAGPSGGTPDKPVGTVWFAVSGPNVEVVEKQEFKGDRHQIRQAAATHAVSMLKQFLT